MKLTVQDVAKLTGLSISTVRQYSWRMKVGSKEGTRKFFTREEAKKIGSGSQPKPVAKKGKAKTGKAAKGKVAKKTAARKRKR